MKNSSNLYQSARSLLIDSFFIKNKHALPSLSKITLSFDLGNTGSDKKVLDNCVQDMVRLTGSQPIVKKAKFSDANFKIREGQPISVVLTLRKGKMFDFLDRMINVALPRIKDFKGLNPSFDNLGNFVCRIDGDSSVFLEANFAKDLVVNFAIKNSNPEKSKSLLELINVPFV